MDYTKTRPAKFHSNGLCNICDFNNYGKCAKPLLGDVRYRNIVLRRGWCGIGQIAGEEMHLITPEYTETKERVRYFREGDDKSLREALRLKDLESLSDFEIVPISPGKRFL